MKNREWLQSMALYDLLMMISMNACSCIMMILDVPLEDIKHRCDGECSKCLQAWLNEERK